MKIDPTLCPFPLSKGLVALLEEEMTKAKIPPGVGCIINFRDPKYSSERGGYHPVEISIDGARRVLYITDFSFVGRPPFAELAKELDFDSPLASFSTGAGSFPWPTAAPCTASGE